MRKYTRKHTDAERAVIRAEFLKPWHVQKRELEAQALRWAASTPELEPMALMLLKLANCVERGDVEIPVVPYPFPETVSRETEKP
jgi:hypothetical protein